MEQRCFKMQPNITDNTNGGKQKETKLIEDDIANCCGKFNGECFFPGGRKTKRNNLQTRPTSYSSMIFPRF